MYRSTKGTTLLIYTKPSNSQRKINRLNLCFTFLIVTLAFSFPSYALNSLLRNRRGKKGRKVVQRFMACFVVLLLHPVFSPANKKK